MSSEPAPEIIMARVPTPLRECAQLPKGTLTDLAGGPLEDPACGVCVALDAAREWANGDGGAAWAKEDPERWMRTSHAIEMLKQWHDPVGQDTAGFIRPLGKAIEHLGWEIADDGSAARSAFFRIGGDGHQVLNQLGGDISWPRCLLIYVLAGWRPEEDATDATF